MNNDISEYEKIVADALGRSSFAKESLAIIGDLCPQGKIFLVGSMVYRPIIEHLYSIPMKQDSDIDFLVEMYPEKPEKSNMLLGWDVGFTHLENYKFTRGEQRIDCMPLDGNLHNDDMKEFSLLSPHQKILSYLKQVPLSIQSIAYDLETKKLYGDVSIHSIHFKKIYVNCEESATSYRAMYDMTLAEYIDKKYGDLGFEYML